MALIDLYTKQQPATSKANLKGGDKTLIEADGGLDLSKNEKELTKARKGELGKGGAGYTPKAPYTASQPK
jgi:hypothetical protein